MATISGIVKDSSGVIIPSAAATAANTETGVSRMTRSGTEISYHFPALPVTEIVSVAAEAPIVNTTSGASVNRGRFNSH